MRSLIPFDGLFGNTVLDHFFDDDMPTVYQDYTAVPKVDIEDKKDHYEITCDMPGFKKEEIHILMRMGSCLWVQRRKTRRMPMIQSITTSAANVLLSPSASVHGERHQGGRHQSGTEGWYPDHHAAEGRRKEGRTIASDHDRLMSFERR